MLVLKKEFIKWKKSFYFQDLSLITISTLFIGCTNKNLPRENDGIGLSTLTLEKLFKEYGSNEKYLNNTDYKHKDSTDFYINRYLEKFCNAKKGEFIKTYFKPENISNISYSLYQ